MLRMTPELTAETVTKLALLANESPDKPIAVNSDTLLSLCWAWADSEGGCLETFIEREQKIKP